MRPALFAVLFAVPAFAGPSVDCTLERHSGDIVEKGKDVVVSDTAQNIVAIDGNVTLKRGAKVRSVLVTGGRLTVEAGATVDGAVIAMGGPLTVDPKAKVKGSRITVDHAIQVVDEDGETLNVNLSLGGKTLGERLLESVVSELKGCRVVEK